MLSNLGGYSRSSQTTLQLTVICYAISRSLCPQTHDVSRDFLVAEVEQPTESSSTGLVGRASGCAFGAGLSLEVLGLTSFDNTIRFR